jgi:hypothetical protein
MNKIALLNDAFRRTFRGGKVMMTSGVDELPDCVKAEALSRQCRNDDPSAHAHACGGVLRA